MHGYTTYKRNTSNEGSDGIALLIKQQIKHKMEDDFISDVLEVRLETLIGEIAITTTYLPTRRPYLSYPDFHRLIYKNIPTYITGDLNAKHRLLRDNTDNQVGTVLDRFFESGTLFT